MKTAFILMAQYEGKAVIPVDVVCADYFAPLTVGEFLKKTLAECSRLYSMWGAETDRLKRLEALKRLAWLEVIDKKLLGKGIAA